MTDHNDNDLQGVLEIASRLLNRETLLPNEDLYEAGLTSIMVLSLLTELESAFHLTIPDNVEFLDARTPLALVRMIHRLRE